MKKCPFCKAEIEEDARFCLYCMKPLNEKTITPPIKSPRRGWLWIGAGILLLALVVLIFLLSNAQKNLPTETTGEETISATTGADQTEGTKEEPQPSQGAGAPADNTEFQEPPTTDSGHSSEQAPDLSISTKPITTTEPSLRPEAPSEPEETAAEAPEPAETVQEPAEPKGSEPEPAEPKPTEPQIQPSTAVYSYRAAIAGDDFNANYVNSGSDIVITGVEVPASNGVYDIPAYIDGQRVIAIIANAFYGSNARSVYVPSTVKTIWNYAFNGCSLTDLYFRGNAIYMEHNAFSGSVTIHCSESCSDRNLRYYKNSAVSYGAVWEEWNG